MNAHDYQRIEASIQFIEANYRDDPSLREIAASADLSPFHFERLFKRWAGTTPKRFVQCLRVEHAKSLLEHSRNILDVSWDTGLSSPSRLHDLFCSVEAVTPGEYKSGGEGLEIRHGIYPTPFGDCLIAITERGICHFAFCDAATETSDAPRRRDRGDHARELRELRDSWPRARFEADGGASEALIARLFDGAAPNNIEPFHLLVKGTNFQIQVWRALISIPPGCVVSYKDVANRVGRTDAVRAVAGAIAANSIGYLIPCHRVLRSTGALSGYRWGRKRKRALLAWESASSEAARSLTNSA
jgi:AraC family transcriptional regulator of adaptative response/methylated-DNA-[protein]-cysteine methyltransferase